MFPLVVITICFPSLIYSLTCHRCFGNDFCHDPKHMEFSAGIRTATCGNVSYWSENDDEVSNATEGRRVLNKNFKQYFGNISSKNFVLEQHCLTASVLEPHDTFTLRTCVTREVPTDGPYPSLCEFVKENIDHQNFYNGSFSCRQCNDGDFCNTHVLADSSSAFVHIGSVIVISLLAALVLTL